MVFKTPPMKLQYSMGVLWWLFIHIYCFKYILIYLDYDENNTESNALLNKYTKNYGFENLCSLVNL